MYDVSSSALHQRSVWLGNAAAGFESALLPSSFHNRGKKVILPKVLTFFREGERKEQEEEENERGREREKKEGALGEMQRKVLTSG